jgi:hypothetical protein
MPTSLLSSNQTPGVADSSFALVIRFNCRTHPSQLREVRMLLCHVSIQDRKLSRTHDHAAALAEADPGEALTLCMGAKDHLIAITRATLRLNSSKVGCANEISVDFAVVQLESGADHSRSGLGRRIMVRLCNKLLSSPMTNHPGNPPCSTTRPMWPASLGNSKTRAL